MRRALQLATVAIIAAPACLPDFTTYRQCESKTDCPERTACVDSRCTAIADAAIVPDSADVTVSEMCIDFDDDGFVAVSGCEHPAGDCAPRDASRRPGAPELCNGVDDDCDMLTDEGDPGGNRACPTGLDGACADGRTACAAGEVVCLPLNMPTDEICNFVDDDCDGSIDEETLDSGLRCATGGVGACAAGLETCVDGKIICLATTNPLDETCNGVDDNCDGLVDEGNPQGGAPCDTLRDGICRDGHLTCRDGNLVCEQSAQPTPELCNGLDDDCDGRADEMWTEILGQSCVAGVGGCTRQGVMACTADGTGVDCDQVPGPPAAQERCTGIDDDCDGQIDEGFATGVQCSVGIGACARGGQTICGEDAASVRCNAVAGAPAEEACNALDDDCDGEIDEAFPQLGAECVVETAPGECPLRGVLNCDPDGTAMVCDAAPRGPEPEICNDFDDDCDGEIDEDFASAPDGESNKGAPCTVGVGACAREAEWSCAAEGDRLICPIEPGIATAEQCDGVDNDCDGRIDNRAVCPVPAAARVIRYALADPADAACADITGDGLPDNGLGAVGPLLNPLIATSIELAQRLSFLRAPGFPPAEGAAFAVELLEGMPSRDGIEILPESLDRLGHGIVRLPSVHVDGDTVDSAPLDAPLSVVSPLFYAGAGQWRPWSHIALEFAALRGRTAAVGDGAFGLADGRLTGRLDYRDLLDDYGAAEEACAAAGISAPPGCGVFSVLTTAQLAASVSPDLPVGEDGRTRISVCLSVATVPAEGVAAPPLGGRACAVDEDCVFGLACYPLPGGDDGSSLTLAPACGIPLGGDADLGSACVDDADCAAGLCAAYRGRSGICSRLCDADVDCPAALACRGVPYPLDNGDVATARMCVDAGESAAPCDADRECPDDDVCDLWLDGDVGVPGGEVWAAGRCGAISDAGAARGQPCEHPSDCDRNDACHVGLDGVGRCMAPCDATASCRAGEYCDDVDLVPAADGRPAVRHGACVPLPPEQGSGGPCAGDLDCPGGEICRAHRLETAEVADRYCRRGEGFFSAGQPCQLGVECAGGVCAEGMCSGVCSAHTDCGPRQGCAPDALVDDETGEPLAGLCRAPNRACQFDDDCDADPLCTGGRCICDGDRCRVGCTPGVGECVGDLFCHANGACAGYCLDDVDEPDDTQIDAHPIRLDRTATGRIELHQLCASSPVDWYVVDTGGQPLLIEIGLEPADTNVTLDVDAFDATGNLIAEAVYDSQFSRWTLRVDDPQFLSSPAAPNAYIRVRGAGFGDALVYRVDASLAFPPCPDDADEPRDAQWQWTPALTATGDFAQEVIDGWVCPQDNDWYAVYLENGDELRVQIERFDGPDPSRDDIEVEILGPGFERERNSAVRLRVGPDDDGDVRWTPPNKFCDETGTLLHCAYENIGPVIDRCLRDDQCTGGPWFLRVRGVDRTHYGPYRLTLTVDRAVGLSCVHDVFEQNDLADNVTLRMSRGGVDPAAMSPREIEIDIDDPDPYGPLVLHDREVVLRDLVGCGISDPDFYTIYFPNQSRIEAEIRQHGPQLFEFGLAIYNPFTFEVVDERYLEDAVMRFPAVDLAGEPDTASLIGYFVETPPSATGIRYDLAFRATSLDIEPDLGCQAPIDVNVLGEQPMAIGNDTAGAIDHHRSPTCFGFAGPDRIFRVNVPGPGRLRAQVTSIGDRMLNPSVAIRSACDQPASELACNADDPDAAERGRRAAAEARLATNSAFVIVDSDSGPTAGEFLLTLTWESD